MWQRHNYESKVLEEKFELPSLKKSFAKLANKWKNPKLKFYFSDIQAKDGNYVMLTALQRVIPYSNPSRIFGSVTCQNTWTASAKTWLQVLSKFRKTTQILEQRS